MELSYTTHILNLPEEVIEHVLSYLTYPELQKIRPTCKVFETTCRQILSLGLSKLAAKVDVAITRFLAAEWYRGVHSSKRARAAYHRRLYRGTGSLMVLAGLVRTSQACSVHQVRAGEFPPLPAQFLQDVQDAVRYASRRNPLVGRNRLEALYKTVGKYFEKNVISAKHLSSLTLFRTVLDVIVSLPGEATLILTGFGIRYTKPLPRVQIFMPPIDPDTGCPQILMLKLVQLGMHAVSRYVMTDQVVHVEFQPSGVMHTKTVTEVRLEVGCQGVSSIQQLKTATPSYFCVTFIVPLYVTSSLEVDQEFEEYTHVFRNCGND